MKAVVALALTFSLPAFALAAEKVTPIIFKLEKNLGANETVSLANELKKDRCVSEASGGLGGHQGILFVTIKSGCFESVDHSALTQKIAQWTGMRVRKATYTYSDNGGGKESYYVQTGNFLVYPKKEISEEEMSSRIKNTGFEIIQPPSRYLPAFLVRKANVLGYYSENEILREKLGHIDGVRFVAADNPTFTIDSRPDVIEHPSLSELKN